MVVSSFPPVELADQNGLLAIGGDLDPHSLLLAYSSGIFPWPYSEEHHLTWFAPPIRAILKTDHFIVSKSLSKFRKKFPHKICCNRDFKGVILNCAASKNRQDQQGTWNTKGMVEAYIKLHKAGYAHSVECWSEDRLVGGFYGVSIGSYFAGESMFYLVPNTSKLTLWYFVEYLKDQGIKWLDGQVPNPYLSSLGATEIERDRYQLLLKEAINGKQIVFPDQFS